MGMSASEQRSAGVSEALAIARQLVQLLEDPHPGLRTWQGAVHSTAGRLAQSMGYELGVEKEAADQRYHELAREWMQQKCTRCGGPRDYQSEGQLQVVCHGCAHPEAPVQIRMRIVEQTGPDTYVAERIEEVRQ